MLLLLSYHPQFSSPSGEIGTNPNQPSPFHFSSFSSEQTPTSSELANQNLSKNRCQQVEIDQISHRQVPMDNSKQHQKLQPTQNQCKPSVCFSLYGSVHFMWLSYLFLFIFPFVHDYEFFIFFYSLSF